MQTLCSIVEHIVDSAMMLQMEWTNDTFVDQLSTQGGWHVKPKEESALKLIEN
jgi:hypothetical protein